MADNKPARVKLVAVDGDGNEVEVLCDADGKLVLAAGVTIDPGTLALHADVDNLETLVTSTNTKLDALGQPTTFTAITPNDNTNVTATCSKGLLVTATGVVNVTGTGGSAVGLGTWPAGSYIPGALSRVNAATTATVVGLS